MSIKQIPIVPKNISKENHERMMGDGTEEQNLNQAGDPSLRIKKEEVEAAFGKSNTKKA
jgi:hypothetical protein